MSRVVLVPGGAGYIGSVLVGQLLDRGLQVRVLDRLFFGTESIARYEIHQKFRLIRYAVRYFDEGLLEGVDVVMDLSGIANDPSCDLDPEAPVSISHRGPVRVATLA